MLSTCGKEAQVASSCGSDLKTALAMHLICTSRRTYNILDVRNSRRFDGDGVRRL
jgi:hypothetical protein